MKLILSGYNTMHYTFLSCPALANNFPSVEKWQQTTFPLLLRIELTSLKLKPEMSRNRHCYGQFEKSNSARNWKYCLLFEASAACSEEFLFKVPNKSLPSPSSWDKKDSTLSSKEPTSAKCSMSSCKEIESQNTGNR